MGRDPQGGTCDGVVNFFFNSLEMVKSSYLVLTKKRKKKSIVKLRRKWKREGGENRK